MESEVNVKVPEEELNYALYTTDIFTVKLATFVKDIKDDAHNRMLYNMLVRHRELPKKLPKRVYTVKGLEKAILEAESYVVPRVKILKIVDYTIPMYGNSRCMPYGKLKVTDGTDTKIVEIKDDGYHQYFTFNRHRYYIKSVGSLYSPSYEIDYNHVS